MKKYYSFVWCVAFTLFLFGTLLTNAQNTSESEFLREITENELQITTEQRTRFENVKRNPIYKQVKAVKIGNIKALQNRSRLPISIPGRQGALTARVDRLETSTENNFVWNGKFEEEEGAALIIAKDGAIYGQINVGNEIYEIHDLGKQQNLTGSN